MKTISIGDRFANVHAELDGADSDQIGTNPFVDAEGERTTPPRSIWVVTRVYAQYVTIVCELTGAAINPTWEELRNSAMYEPIEPADSPVEDQELFDASPDCEHDVRPAPFGGGIKCTKCPGWFCF